MKTLIACFIIPILLSCSTTGNKIVELTNSNNSDTLGGSIALDTLKKTKINCELTNKSAVYIVDINKEGKEFLVKGDSLDLIKHNISSIISSLNSKFQVKIQKVKTASDTLFVRIINSTVFTQQIGDTGADWYLASMVYSLTEGGEIKFVNVLFDEGDHGGVSGLKSRNTFMDLYLRCN